MIKRVEKAFEEYLKSYDKSVKQIRYKYHHSYEVEHLMERLAVDLNLSKEKIELAKVIGLLHDIGRFEQIRKYGICSDTKTGCDHADESCKYLFDDNHIRDFIVEKKYDNIIKNAIKNHNKYEIEKALTGDSLLFAKMIRDMDKVDIYRVLSEEYSPHFDKDKVDKKILEYFENEKTVKLFKETTEFDYVIIHSALVFDINFRESFKILKEKNYLNSYFKTVVSNDESSLCFNEVKKKVNNYIEKKIGE